jgi:RNA polymerase sporulation-specific sigma factor
VKVLEESNKNINFTPLSEQEKNELVMKYKRIVYYIGNRCDFLDKDKEEIIGWGFYGLAKAINDFEKDRDICLEAVIFSKIKSEVFRHYSQNRRPKSEVSLHLDFNSGKDGNSRTLEDLIASENQLSFTLNEIRNMIEEAIFEEKPKNKKIILDWLFAEKSIDEIAKESGISQTLVKRTQRRGHALIKQYLINNDVILENLLDPSEEQKKEKKTTNCKKISSFDYGKLKYMQKNFPFLNVNDLAQIMCASSYEIMKLFDYPTSEYVRVSADQSIHEKVIMYIKRKYPERLPGEVIPSHISC